MKRLWLKVTLALGVGLFGAPAWALQCSEQSYKGNTYVLCEVDATAEDLRLFLNDASGTAFGHFDAVDAALAETGERLAFAMNAGMYHEDRAPVGHYVENGDEVMRVVPNPGPGNFGMVPNGVFCIRQGRADVVETLKFQKTLEGQCRFATQSGPMLVIDGELHPRFLKDSTWRYLRNGVGTSADGKRVVFVISRNAVTFHEFGSFFRDALGLPQALYFDGNISRLYAPALGRADGGRRMGPVVGVVVPVE
ncbi:phosphodiester glycosidase family protein [Pseudooceanicola sp. LIPI14-2-Ac024]|uniref:phosphodiester glycosidase family protein n=1 Tax=Pseudooceanicola sp. LIPI14-2-Ac024 TaxID=3344875 RepID=UPI0035D00457